MCTTKHLSHICNIADILTAQISIESFGLKHLTHIDIIADILPTLNETASLNIHFISIERETGIPLDLVVLINNFFFEKLTDENFKQAIHMWFENEEECRWRFGHISDWNTSRVTDMNRAFYSRQTFNQNISRWNVRNVTDMSEMFLHSNRNILQK
jgi:surface protein